jgi:small subunit ribosomal protein S15
MLTKRQKTTVIKAVQRHVTDTGSPEAQVGLLSKKIDALAAHLKKNNKDVHSRRGLLKMVADRRSHMVYLADKNPKAHRAVAKKLGLKK